MYPTVFCWYIINAVNFMQFNSVEAIDQLFNICRHMRVFGFKCMETGCFDCHCETNEKIRCRENIFLRVCFNLILKDFFWF